MMNAAAFYVYFNVPAIDMLIRSQIQRAQLTHHELASAPRGIAAKVRLGNLKARVRGVYHSMPARNSYDPCHTEA